MNKFIFSLFFLFIFTLFNISYSHGPTRQKLKESVIINAKPAEVWNVIKDFGKINTWHPSISKVDSDSKNESGSVRIIYLTPINFKGISSAYNQENKYEINSKEFLNRTKNNLEIIKKKF